ncbi:threonine--tRNA ligase [Candidatus Uhrbacteria bacterium]|nr:threonine--tRNA ligase [Candidatus Uhrbacteria bacterium]
MDKEHLEHLRHSTAHLLAAAVMELYPGTRRTIGPAIEEGFYYDFEFLKPISETDLPAIEEKMHAILKTWEGFERRKATATEVRDLFCDNPYKLELIDQIVSDKQPITLYQSGDYIDLCRGGHVKNPQKEMGHFKLLSLAGAYWRGDERNPMLTRIYGTAFPTKGDLDAYLLMMEEAKQRDHRKLGVELDLFTFSPLVGPGLPLFTPKGATIRRLLERFVWSLMKPFGYERVDIPHMAKAELYKTSGHWDKFSDDIFHISSKKTSEAFVMKPMNCPHHTQIYASRPRSYRDLPIRYSEVTKVYRDENTGQLQGLSRVRSITQDDAHVFCTPDQILDEARNIYKIIQGFYGRFHMPLEAHLSISGPAAPEKYLGAREVWERAEGILRDLLKEFGLPYEEAVGEAAFYGPKIDFIARDAIGRKWQLATIQLDFNQPERFGLEYTDTDGEKKRPVMIHRAISGSLERFMAILIEHYAGAFPLWLAPVQVVLVSVGERHEEFVRALAQEWRKAGVRVDIDVSSEKIGGKVRKAAMQKVPWTIVVGDKEVAGGDFQVKVFGSDKPLAISAQEAVSKILSARSV